MARNEPTPFAWGDRQWKARVPVAKSALFGSHMGRFHLAGPRWAAPLVEIAPLRDAADLPQGAYTSGTTICIGEHVIGWLLPLEASDFAPGE